MDPLLLSIVAIIGNLASGVTSNAIYERLKGKLGGQAATREQILAEVKALLAQSSSEGAAGSSDDVESLTAVIALIEGTEYNLQGEGTYEVIGADISEPTIIRNSKFNVRGAGPLTGVRVGRSSPPATPSPTSGTGGKQAEVNVQFGSSGTGLGVYCAKCDTGFGAAIDSTRCPICSGPFSAPPR